MKTNYPISMLCQLLEVSPSGYYDWQKRRCSPGKRATQDKALAREIAHIHLESRRTYGSPRITRQLANRGCRHGRNRIARLMRQQNLSGRHKRRYRVRTTDSNHSLPIAPNRLAKARQPRRPNQIWVADITYIKTAEGWLFLAAILDLYSRRIVGWAMSPWIDTTLILRALQMAVSTRHPSPKLLFHSDRGVQYASKDYRKALKAAGLRASMSRKGNCYDNATMESFWSTLKLELVYRRQFQSRTQARSEIFDYIECFYNRKRIHSALGYLSPIDFEQSKN